MTTITVASQITKDTVCDLLRQIGKQNPHGRILLVLDNHNSHWARKTRATATELGIRLVFLPPYSLFLNLIEPVWKSLKRMLSPQIIVTADQFRVLVTEAFLRLTQRLNFAGDWIVTFLPDIRKPC